MQQLAALTGSWPSRSASRSSSTTHGTSARIPPPLRSATAATDCRSTGLAPSPNQLGHQSTAVAKPWIASSSSSTSRSSTDPTLRSPAGTCAEGHEIGALRLFLPVIADVAMGRGSSAGWVTRSSEPSSSCTNVSPPSLAPRTARDTEAPLSHHG